MDSKILLRKIENDMIEQCLKYAKNCVDKVYVYGCCEGKATSANCFFQKGGKLYTSNKLNEIDSNIDVSKRAMSNLLHELVKSIRELKQLSNENDFSMPTELKIIYDTNLNKIISTVQYTNQFDYENLLGWDHIFKTWFEEKKSEIEG